MLASGSADYTVKLWNNGTFECQSTLSGLPPAAGIKQSESGQLDMLALSNANRR
jgi:WD40 repeat protein